MEEAGKKRRGRPPGTAVMEQKTTLRYSADDLRRLELLRERWGVPSAEVVRRALKLAARSEGLE